MRPETVVIKPTSVCVGNCIGCVYRQDLYREIKSENQLDLKKYRKLFLNLYYLGLKKLLISGGEPTLYPQIKELVNLAKKFKFEVGLNTTGYGLTNDLIDYENLDAVNFSLHGHNKEIDSKIRSEIIFNNTIKGIKIVKKHSHISVNINTIVNRNNYDSLDKILDLLIPLEINGWLLSYVESDWENKNLLLSKPQINKFNSEIKPKLREKISSLILNEKNKVNALKQIDNLFSMSLDDASRGIYNPNSECSRKENFCIILPNGDVHPCNMMEYTHKPIAGNLFKNNFTQLWYGKKWTDFRNSKYEYCKYCPVNIRCSMILK